MTNMKLDCVQCEFCNQHVKNTMIKEHMEVHKITLECQRIEEEISCTEEFECPFCAAKVHRFNINSHMNFHKFIEEIKRLKRLWWQCWK